MSNIVVGIDIGTTKVCTAICRIAADGEAVLLGKGMSPCLGVKKGVITDIDKIAACVRMSVNQAEESAGLKVYSAYVNIFGAHVNIIRSHNSVIVSNDSHEITENDVQRVLYNFGHIPMSEEMQVIDVIPTQFIVDGYNGISDPAGMVGTRLEVDADVVAGRITSVRNIVRSIEKAGLKVDGMIIEGLSSGCLALTADEKETGVMLIDVGGGITDVTVYNNGKIIFYGSILAGGDHITNDMAVCLKITQQDAEKIKKDYELALLTLIKNNHDIPMTETSTGRKKTVRISEIVDIIEARLSEILQLCKDTATNNGIADEQYHNIVLTGRGISYLDGAAQIAGTIFGKPARISVCKGKDTAGLEFSVVTGMIKHVAGLNRTKSGGSEVRQEKPREAVKPKRDFSEKLSDFLRNFF